MEKKDIKKVVLAYSGGLDTCFNEIGYQPIENGFVLARIITNVDASVALVVYAPGLSLCRADKGQSCSKI